MTAPAPSRVATEDLIGSFGANLEPIITEGLSRLAISLREQGFGENIIEGEVMRTAGVASLVAELRAQGTDLGTALEPPVLITGFGRTGSTFLHNLMACDPALRAAKLWELWRPFPAPRPAHRDYRVTPCTPNARTSVSGLCPTSIVTVWRIMRFHIANGCAVWTTISCATSTHTIAITYAY
jgi:hypothetical protein